jgi:hypothetical protein
VSFRIEQVHKFSVNTIVLFILRRQFSVSCVIGLCIHFVSALNSLGAKVLHRCMHHIHNLELSFTKLDFG